MRDLLSIAKRCEMLLCNLAIPYGNVVSWKVNTRAKRRWGQCRKLPNGDFEININIDLLQEENSIRGLEETILHELLHTCPGCLNHGPEWKHYAWKVNTKYGYNITTTSSAECKGVVKRREAKSKYKYKVVCKKCNRNYMYQRMCHTIACAKVNLCTCSCGSSEFNVIEL